MKKLFADEEDQKYGTFTRFQYSLPTGEIAEVYATEKWLQIQKLEKERKQSPNDWVKINFSGPNGTRIEILKVGTDIDEDEVAEKKDPETGELFGIYFFGEGKELRYLTERWLWTKIKDNIARLVKESVKDAMEGTGNQAVIENAAEMFTKEGLVKLVNENRSNTGPNKRARKK